MANDKDLRKSLKGPDGFQLAVAKVLDWVASNQMVVFGVMVGFLAVFAGVIGWQYWQDKQVTERQEQLAAIEDRYQDEAEKVEKERQKIRDEIAALDKTGKDDKAKGEDAKAKTPNPKKDALESKMNALKADHSGSFAEYKKYYETHDATPEGWLAGLRVASVLLGDKKLAEARPVLENILEKSKADKFYQTQTRFILVNVYTEEKAFDKALGETDKLTADVSSELKPQVLLLKARLLTLKGDKDASNKTLDSLIKEYATSAEAQKAKSMKALILN